MISDKMLERLADPTTSFTESAEEDVDHAINYIAMQEIIRRLQEKLKHEKEIYAIYVQTSDFWYKKARELGFCWPGQESYIDKAK